MLKAQTLAWIASESLCSILNLRNPIITEEKFAHTEEAIFLIRIPIPLALS